MTRRGIVLAGGSGTRLAPLTDVTNKHLLPIADRPMIHYPLSTLVLAGIRDLLVITTPQDLPRFEALLEDGARWGLAIRYAGQPRPEGIAQALVIAGDFLAGQPCALILGDNVFAGEGLEAALARAGARASGSTIFGRAVPAPERFAVAELAPDGRVLSLEEKPAAPRSAVAVTGLYFYDAEAVGIAAGLRPSKRGELEITDVNADYLRRGLLHCEVLGGETAWFDAGTHASLGAVRDYVAESERKTGRLVGSIAEAAWRRGFIDDTRLLRLAAEQGNAPSAAYLRSLVAARTSATP